MATEIKVLGKVIGFFDTWDSYDDDLIVFNNVQLNELGKKFIKRGESDFDTGSLLQLTISFYEGIVTITTDEAGQVDINPDWTLFNKE